MPHVQRLTVPELAKPPGYAHVVVAIGTRIVTTAGAVPLDAKGNFVGAGDVRAQARRLPSCHSVSRSENPRGDGLND